MFGNFQQSNLRIEIAASESTIRDSLLRPAQIQKWLMFQQFSQGLPEEMHRGLKFTSYVGPVAIQHEVATIDPNRLRLLLGQGIDGFHEWRWGDGWVQSRLEGITLLPLNLGQTLSLSSLRQFLVSQ